MSSAWCDPSSEVPWYAALRTYPVDGHTRRRIQRARIPGMARAACPDSVGEVTIQCVQKARTTAPQENLIIDEPVDSHVNKHLTLPIRPQQSAIGVVDINQPSRAPISTGVTGISATGIINNTSAFLMAIGTVGTNKSEEVSNKEKVVGVVDTDNHSSGEERSFRNVTSHVVGDTIETVAGDDANLQSLRKQADLPKSAGFGEATVAYDPIDSDPEYQPREIENGNWQCVGCDGAAFESREAHISYLTALRHMCSDELEGRSCRTYAQCSDLKGSVCKAFTQGGCNNKNFSHAVYRHTHRRCRTSSTIACTKLHHLPSGEQRPCWQLVAVHHILTSCHEIVIKGKTKCEREECFAAHDHPAIRVAVHQWRESTKKENTIEHENIHQRAVAAKAHARK